MWLKDKRFESEMWGSRKRLPSGMCLTNFYHAPDTEPSWTLTRDLDIFFSVDGDLSLKAIKPCSVGI